MEKTDFEVISELKKKFPNTNPQSFLKVSNKQLAEWYSEYIVNGKNVKWDRNKQRFIID